MRHLLLALFGVAASLGTASAQGSWSPTPLAPPALPRQQSASPAALSDGVAQAGCSTCAPAAVTSGGLHARLAASPLTIGAGCANSPYCGTLASERTFLFGSCRQFFNAGNKCGGGGCGSAYGPGGFGDGSPCKYGSYLNR